MNGADKHPDFAGIASRQRGAWIETGKPQMQLNFWPASPLGNEGRGLKFHHKRHPTGVSPMFAGIVPCKAWVQLVLDADDVHQLMLTF